MSVILRTWCSRRSVLLTPMTAKDRLLIFNSKSFGQLPRKDRSILRRKELKVNQKRHFPTGPEYARLTPIQVSSILRVNEVSVEIHEGCVQGFELNQLASNSPIEDRLSEAKVLTHNAFLFGVFDGHAGTACAQAISERLFDYLTAFLSPAEVIEPYAKRFKLGEPFDMVQPELTNNYLKDNHYSGETLDDVSKKGLVKIISEMSGTGDDDLSTEENIKSAFMRLDQDLVTEALPSATNTTLNNRIMEEAFSGACACVAYVSGRDLHVANVGDCRAVLGTFSEGEEDWKALELSKEHNAENELEVKRLMSSHPNESTSLIKAGRLLGQLIPLRAFGDVRYKWAIKDLKHVMKTVTEYPSIYEQYGMQLIPPNYRTPPYLSAEPEVVYHRLRPKDKFLVLASDGLWELLSPEKVVKLVAGHLDGEQVLEEFILPENLNLLEIDRLLQKRKQSLAKRTVDSNVATHLLRNALGPDHARLSALLSLPKNVVRNYRDDISLTVIFFDSDYTEVHPFHEIHAESHN